MRSGIIQLLLVTFVLFQVVLAEKPGNKTSETDDEKDIIKEETGRISFHMRPRSDSGYDGSKSVSRSKSSSKSNGSGSGKGYGYGSNGPDDKGPQGGSYDGYRRPSYSPSYDDSSKGSSEAYKSSREEGYRGGYHRDSSPEYSSSYEDHYDSRGRFRPHYDSDKSYTKTYSSGPGQNRGFSSSSGRYDKDDDLPSVSPDGYIESHSNQQTSAEKYDPQEYGAQGYVGQKDTYGGQSYQGGPPLTSSHGYSEHSGRDVSTGYGAPTTYGGFTPMTNVGGVKHEPYSNVIGAKEIDAGKVLFVKQLGGAPSPQIQGKNIYESNEGKLGLGIGQQQGYLLFPVVPKGTEEGNTGYGGRDTYSGLSEGKTMGGLVKNAGYKTPEYPQQLQNYGIGAGYGFGGHQVENVAYQQDKGGYGQNVKAVPKGKHVSSGAPEVYVSGGGHPKQRGPSNGAGHTYGGESYGVTGGHGPYDNSAKYGSPATGGKTSSHGVQYPIKSGAPGNEGYGYTIAGDSYKNVGPSVGGYSGTGSVLMKDYPGDYRGVVNFAGGPSSGYAGGDGHDASVESQGKSGASYDSAGPAGGAVGYAHMAAGIGHGDHKSYPVAGYVGEGDSKSPASGYGEISPKGVEPQPVAPKDKKSKSVAIILQKQPLNIPSLGPVSSFGPELDTQFKAPFKDYLGGSDFDFNLGSYGAGISDFSTGFKGRGASDLLHGFDDYNTGLSPFTYTNNAKFY